MAAVVLAAGALAYAPAALFQPSPAEPTSQESSYLRVVHASPDAPAVDVLLDNVTVVSNVSYGTVGEYLEVESGTYNLTITAAGDVDTVVFDGNVTLEARTVTTVAASGESTENATTAFAPRGFADDALTPGANDSAVRIVHLSPDAPTVDVTAENGSVVLAENVSFGNSSAYVTVPAGNYTVEIRADTPAANGTVVETADVSLAGGEVYSAWALGYLEPETAPADEPFAVSVTMDASATILLPVEETPTPNGTETPMGTATEAPNGTDTETPMGTATEAPNGTDTETPMGTATEAPNDTDTETPMGTATETATP